MLVIDPHLTPIYKPHPITLSSKEERHRAEGGEKKMKGRREAIADGLPNDRMVVNRAPALASIPTPACFSYT